MELLIIIFIATIGCCYSVTSKHPITCPHLCNCDKYLTEIMCLNKSLKFLPEDLPITSQTLDISNNNIRSINTKTIHQLQQLNTLDISFNELVEYPQPCALSNHNISRLHIRNNKVLDILYDRRNNSNHTNQELCLMSNIKVLDISNNILTELPENMLLYYPQLYSLNASYNKIKTINGNLGSSNIISLDLSHNYLSNLSPSSFNHLDKLQTLNLSSNILFSLDSKWCLSFINLLNLDLDNNYFSNISQSYFNNCNSLKELHISHMPSLTSVHDGVFKELQNLEKLVIKNNKNLQYLSTQILKPINLSYLDISENNIQILHKAFWHDINKLDIMLIGGNPLKCDCNIISLWEQIFFNRTNPIIVDKENIYCDNAKSLQSFLKKDLLCSAAVVTKATQNITLTFSDHALLNCSSSGSPSPITTWITPHSRVLQYDPQYGQTQKAPNLDIISWYPDLSDTNTYTIDYKLKERMVIMENGSLQILQIESHDGGIFKCIVHNNLGYNKTEVRVYLNYDSLHDVKLKSIIFGILVTFIFLLISIIFSSIRSIYENNDPVKIKKRKSITDILETLDSYRSERLEKLTAYTAEKVDKLSAYKKDKIDQLFSYNPDRVNKIKIAPKLTLGTIALYMKWMKMYYSSSASFIKESCIQQGERIREQYTERIEKFNDYRCIQIDRIRLQYNTQVISIHDFGTKQMESLREQYKTQQQHILKLLELIEIGNCKSVIEEECNNTEQMLFDESKILELREVLPISTIAHYYGYSEDSEYDTASSSSNNHLSGLTIPPNFNGSSLLQDQIEEVNEDMLNLKMPIFKFHPKLTEADSKYLSRIKYNTAPSNTAPSSCIGSPRHFKKPLKRRHKSEDIVYDSADNDSLAEELNIKKKYKRKKCRCSRHKKRQQERKTLRESNPSHEIDMENINNSLNESGHYIYDIHDNYAQTEEGIKTIVINLSHYNIHEAVS